jgi:glycosyltransferase involved in cell wall biosynthesis
MYGAERWILALVRHLPAAQVDSVVGVVKDEPGDEPELCGYITRLGARAQVFESHGKLNWDGVRQIRQFIGDNDIDILHTHGYKTDVVGFLAARGTACKTVSTPHGWSTAAGAKVQFYEFVDRLLFPFFDAVAPLSDELLRGLRKVPGLSKKLRLILNGVDVAEIDAIADVAAEGDAWRGAGDFVVGYVGQLIPRKGIANLIRAFDALEIDRKRLCIVGDGPQRAELEAIAERTRSAARIHFLGYRQDRIALLKAFDVFVLPSSLEGIPRCLLEAMAAGIAVAASDVPGCTDIVTTDENGLLFEYGNEEDICRVMTRLADPALRMRYSVSARALVVDKYSAARMAQEYLELYESLLVARGASASGATELRE